MRPAPRELKKPSGYFIGYGTTSESPITVTLINMPFWDISALLSAVRYQVTTRPPAGSTEVMPRMQYMYRVAGMTDAHFGDEEVSFSFIRSTRLSDMITRVKDVYDTTLTETYAQRARSEARLRTSLPNVKQSVAELAVDQTVRLDLIITEHSLLPEVQTGQEASPSIPA